MTETLSGALIEALRAAGIPAYPEYPQILKPLPAVPFFVTAAASETVFGLPLQSSFGDAVPVSMTIRLRLHGSPAADFSQYAEQTDACILQTLMQKNTDLREIRFGEIRYVKQIDRLVRETLLRVSGICYLTEEDSA